MNQHRRQLRCVDAVMAELNQAHRAVAAGLQVGREFAQHLVGVLVPLIDQRCEVALGVKHNDLPFLIMPTGGFASRHLVDDRGGDAAAIDVPIRYGLR